MRNDEKIDIQLDNLAEEDLTEEELAQENYDTALRYINIAEHMKQYEDQDKYYHRAIKYLRRARPYKKVRPLLMELRKKKYAARAQGKLALYKEACAIRDKAQTANDYYSAQALFYRIHRYSENRDIPKKWVTPELYQQVLECDDALQQAKYCEQMAQKKIAKLKRHNLFVAAVTFAVIGAALFFIRTIAFRQCLASVYAMTGDTDKAWRTYLYIYEQTDDPKALSRYESCRYQTAVKASRTDNTEEIRSHFRELAKLGYKDSEAKLVEMEKARIAEMEPGKRIRFGDVNWRVLDHQDGKTLLLKDKAMGSTPFQKGGGICTWETSSVRKWLNRVFLNETFSDLEREAILETKVKTPANPIYQTAGGNDTVDRAFLLSCQEVERYQDNIPKSKTCWWLRTPGAYAGSMSFVYRNKTIMAYGYDAVNANITMKPAVWVSTK